MVALAIYEFIILVLNVVFNDYVFWYLLLPGIIAFGIFKVKKEENKPYLKPMLKFLTIYYVLRTLVIVF